MGPVQGRGSVLTRLIWWAGNLLEVGVAFRAWRAKLWSHYPFFYLFFFTVLLADGACYLAYVFEPRSYASWYWGTDLVSLFVGCGVVLELIWRALSPYRGAQRFARTLGIMVFVGVLCFAVLYSWVAAPAASIAERTHFEVERDFLAFQAIFIFAALSVIGYYAIPIGRNLKGIVLGYGLCIGGSLVSFALRSQIGIGFGAWMLIEPFSYDLALLIWVATLWSYHPNPVPHSTVRIEADYELLLSRTRRALQSARIYLGKATHL